MINAEFWNSVIKKWSKRDDKPMDSIDVPDIDLDDDLIDMDALDDILDDLNDF